MSLLELLEHVELITYLVSFEFYTPHLGVLKGRCVSINSLFHFFNALLYKIVTKELQIY